MKIIIIIAVGLGVYLLLLLVFQLMDILNLKKQNLKEQSIKPKTIIPTKTDVTPDFSNSILGKTKTNICQKTPPLDSSCQVGSDIEESTNKPLTFAKQKSFDAPEQVEYEVDLPEEENREMLPEIDCFEQDKTNEVPCGVLDKELAQLNHLIKKEKLSESETQTALTVVEKIDKTDFFNKVIQQFEKEKNETLLSGLREKIKERELAESKTTVAATTAKKSGSVMTDKELEAYL